MNRPGRVLARRGMSERAMHPTFDALFEPDELAQAEIAPVSMFGLFTLARLSN